MTVWMNTILLDFWNIFTGVDIKSLFLNFYTKTYLFICKIIILKAFKYQRLDHLHIRF